MKPLSSISLWVVSTFFKHHAIFSSFLQPTCNESKEDSVGNFALRRSRCWIISFDSASTCLSPLKTHMMSFNLSGCQNSATARIGLAQSRQKTQQITNLTEQSKTKTQESVSQPVSQPCSVSQSCPQPLILIPE